MRPFSVQTHLDKHILQCMFLHAPLREKRKDIETYEPPMTDIQQDKMIRKLICEMQKMHIRMSQMQKELHALKQTKRIQIVDVLKDFIPTETIHTWIQSIPIQQIDLECVFKHSLKDGIKQILLNALQQATCLHQLLPITAFTEKQKILYVYTNLNTWEICDRSMLKVYCQALSTRFFQAFLQWQNENDDFLKSSPKAEEQHIQYMQKMMDYNFQTNVQLSKLNEFLYQELHKPLQITHSSEL